MTVDAAGTLNDLIQSINNGAAGKISSIKDNGKGLKIVDNTTGGSTFAITTLNGSAAALDLGISGTFSSGTNDGKDIYTDLRRQTGGGFGFQIERRLNLLVDPADGVITRENREIDDKNSQYDKHERHRQAGRVKRARLERQFANMESVLAGLQNQQSGAVGVVIDEGGVGDRFRARTLNASPTSEKRISRQPESFAPKPKPLPDR